MAEVYSHMEKKENEYTGEKEDVTREKIVAFADRAIKEIWGNRPTVTEEEFLRTISCHHSYFFSSEELRRTVEKVQLAAATTGE